MRVASALLLLGAFTGAPNLMGVGRRHVGRRAVDPREALDGYLRDLDESRMANFLGCLVDPSVNRA